MRLFIAIKLPEDVKEELIKVQKEIGSEFAKIKWVNKEQMHLTLKFLGEVQPDKVEEIINKLKTIKLESFTVFLGFIGVFPSENYIRIVWIGLKPEDKVLELQKQIDEALSKLFKKEKDFKSHITLVRVKYTEDKKQFLEQLKKIKVENKKIEIKDFRLMKSTLTPKGPIYEDLMVFSSN